MDYVHNRPELKSTSYNWEAKLPSGSDSFEHLNAKPKYTVVSSHIFSKVKKSSLLSESLDLTNETNGWSQESKFIFFIWMKPWI